MFEGAYTAIVTPFNKNGEIDYNKFRELINRQIKNKIDGIVPVGTTGESPSLTANEHKKVIEECIKECNGKVKVVAGTGANSTQEAIELTKFAKDAGADGSLQVTPYYNKPTQEGLKQHFSTVADIGLPVVLYNIPSRCGVEIAVDTVVELSKHPNIVGIKEAGGSVKRASDILDKCDICLVSGDDSLAVPMMTAGGKGVISVVSNVIPAEISEMVHNALNSNWTKAFALHRKYFPLFRDLFLVTNPMPVKAAMAMMGLIEEIYRLPLTPLTPDIKEQVRNCLKSLNLIN
jgi:4-hydroxy-tetrahydrodipicolinate synthase